VSWRLTFVIDTNRFKKPSYQKLPLSEQSCSAPHLKHFRWHTVISFISYPHLMHTYNIFLFFLILFWDVFNFFPNFHVLYDKITLLGYFQIYSICSVDFGSCERINISCPAHLGILASIAFIIW